MGNNTRLPLDQAEVPKISEINQKDIISYEELSVYLSLPISSIRELLRREEGFPCRRIGKHLRFSKKAVETWISNGKDGIISEKETDK